MQATDVSVINNYSEGEVIKDMFEIKRANEILLSENDVTQDVLDKLEKGEEPKPTIPAKGVTEYPILKFDDRALNLLHMGVSNTLKYTKVTPKGGKGFEFVKRAFDIVASAGALTVLALPIGVVALIIYLDDKGNPFFSQVRLTKDGKPFKMYKLRSMCIDAEARFAEVQKENQSDGLAFKADDDPRVTRIGKFIRKTSIDELPQLLNILKGDMAVIGPRPFIEEEQKNLPSDRLLVKPGLSCYWQIGGKNELSMPQQIELDRKYIREQSVIVDVKIIMKTMLLVVSRKNG